MGPKLGDDLRTCATTIVMLFLFSLSAHADFDLSLATSLRSYPLSGVIDVDGGYDLLLWGTFTPGSPWYGYLRTSLNSAASVNYEAAGAALEFFPLSFLGGRVGGESVENDADYSSYDCVVEICRGRFYRTYAQAQMTLGAGPFFVQGRWRRERWSEREPGTGTFVEPTAGLSMAGTGDSQTIYRGMFGVQWSATWSTAAVVTYAQADVNQTISRFPLLLMRYVSGAFSAGLGVGAFESALKKQDTSGILFLSWEVQPSLALK